MSAENAATFHKLHEDLLILPNAWDAASARIVQDAGAKAIATTSASNFSAIRCLASSSRTISTRANAKQQEEASLASKQ